MFPRFREQLGTAVDLIVEFSTLGEYRLGADLAPGAPTAPADAPGHAPQLGGAGYPAGRAAGRHTVAGGATGRTPVATPAARRLMPAPAGPAPSGHPVAAGSSSAAASGHRPGANSPRVLQPPAGRQLPRVLQPPAAPHLQGVVGPAAGAELKRFVTAASRRHARRRLAPSRGPLPGRPAAARVPHPVDVGIPRVRASW
jgi:hypothetical protein